ncbi:hypothetical protein AOQ84DRAFT_153754 [Glonium stellatum]|uniref:Secreted protein n=1 Tax=Glonium stellatum TaxID=574774 RepID=A0A8E2JWU5_9PEZI|nr:hypothetical protein AOQ84DRAFT_153754 [Glonium stellatum]
MIMSSFALLICPSFPTISVSRPCLRRPITLGGPSTTASLYIAYADPNTPSGQPQSLLHTAACCCMTRWFIGESLCTTG